MMRVDGKLGFQVLAAAVLGGIFTGMSGRAHADTVPLQWNAVTTNSDGTVLTDLAGYRIFSATKSFETSPGVFISTSQAMTDAAVVKTLVGPTSTSGSVSSLDPALPYYFRLTAYNTGGAQSLFNQNASGNNFELSLPSSILTAPANGAAVSGSAVPMTASASDKDGIARVQFLVNGVVVSTDTTSPYSFNWDSKTVPNGTHTLAAKSFDATSASRTSISVSVNVSNAAPPSCDVDASGSTTISDVQIVVNQVLRFSPCTADLNGDGLCTIVDVQRVANVVLGGACVTNP